MTLSNFDWTDKKTVRWFVLLPTGHEGPYSLHSLEIRKFSSEVQIWAEGLDSPLALSEALAKSTMSSIEEVLITNQDDEVPPPLPPLPEETQIGEHASEVIIENHSLEIENLNTDIPKRKLNKLKVWAGLIVAGLLIGILLIDQWIRSFEKFSITRLPKMSQALHARILSQHQFEGWNKKLFFKEYVPPDLSHIWFVTSSFQTCKIEASFNSSPGKLLTQSEERVSFSSKSILKDHVIQFSKFDFTQGIKIIPGLYEVELKATDCQWDGAVAYLANKFSRPLSEYSSKMNVILYPNGAKEFNVLLEKHIKMQLDKQLKAQGEEAIFWEGLQQKLQTLLAITLQIEQLFVDLLDNKSSFTKMLKSQIDRYTKQFGHSLTQFVVDNDEDSKMIEKNGLVNVPLKRDHINTIRIVAKEIGYESMKIIEGLQRLNNPSKKELEAQKNQMLKTFKNLKHSIGQRLIKVTEESSN